jgi:DNA-binding response OmpR family regulator
VKVLIVEDDLALADVLSFTLRRGSFDVVTAHDGLAALAIWEQEAPDLIVLDLNLPKLDGMAVCRRIRAQGKTPIIILSVRGSDEDVVAALELGADDYMIKPFSPRQLVARVRAVLRRMGVAAPPGLLATAGLTLDRSRNELLRQDQPAVRLTPLETRLLETLMINVGQVLPADMLVDATWGVEGGDRAMLKQLIYRLRAKIEPDPSQPTYIETVPGVGYTLVETPSQ